MSLDVDSVYGVPKAVDDPRALARRLAPILRQDARALERRLASDRQFVWLCRKIDPARADKVRGLGAGEVHLRAESRRFYPKKSLAGPLLGFTGMDNQGLEGIGKIHDPKAFMATTTAAKKVLAENAVTCQGLPKYGTQVLMNVINEVGALPTRNDRDVQFEEASKISGEAMHEKRPTDGKPNLVTNQACFGCTIACGRISKMDEKHFTVENKPQYWGASSGLEYEAAWALGAANGVNDLEALTYANFICNEDGFDPISFGATVGAVMELYEMGVLSKEQIGIEAPFGSAQALTFLAEQVAAGTGFGNEIGQGSKRLCAKYGHPELSMTVKGQEFPAYDSRGIQGMGLTYATSNRGACHLRSYTVSSRCSAHPVKTDPFVTEGKPALVKAFQDATEVFDSSGLCLFTSFAWTLQDVAPQLQAACQGDWSLDHLNLVGERIWNLEREFNLRAGLTMKDDTFIRSI